MSAYSWAHVRHPRDARQSVCGVPAEQVARWQDSDDPRDWHTDTCEDCVSGFDDAARPDDYTHDTGDPALIDSLRTIVAKRQHAKLSGVLIDQWSAEVTIYVWDRVKPYIHQRLLTLPPVELILRCTEIYSSAADRTARREASDE
jgi:hypothetical protein